MTGGVWNGRRLRLAILTLVLLGGCLRVRQYLARMSYWRDEAFVVLNVMDHSEKELLTCVEHGQAAPPLFLWIERAMLRSFGPGEYSLRLLPLLCGLAALVMFASLCVRLLPGAAALMAVAMFAVATRLVLYSAELKQYSGDAMCAVLLFLIAAWDPLVHKDSSGAPGRPSAIHRLAWASAAAAVLVWLSHTVIFVFACVSLVLSIQHARSARRRRFLLPLVWNGLFGASFVLLYLLSIRHEETTWMHQVWHDSFPDWSRPAHVPFWIADRTYGLLDLPFHEWGAVTTALVALGCFMLVRQRRLDLLTMFIGPIVLTLIASLLGKYPFNGSRLMLFLVPALLLLCAAGAVQISAVLPERDWVPIAGLAPLVIAGAVSAAQHFLHPPAHSHIRPVVAYVKEYRQSGQAIYLTGEPVLKDPDPSQGRHLEFLCYWRHPDPPLHTLDPHDWSDVPEREFWVVMPFDPSRQKQNAWMPALLLRAGATARMERSFVEPKGGAAYLFRRRK